MVTTKHCAYGKCRSDSSYSDRPHMKDVYFLRFPNPKFKRQECLKWVAACRRQSFTIDNVKKDTYICSRYFVGGKGPTELSPDPVPATSSVSPTKVCTRSSRKRCHSPVTDELNSAKKVAHSLVPMVPNDASHENMDPCYQILATSKNDECLLDNSLSPLLQESSKDTYEASGLYLLSTVACLNQEIGDNGSAVVLNAECCGSENMTSRSEIPQGFKWLYESSPIYTTLCRLGKKGWLLQVTENNHILYKAKEGKVSFVININQDSSFTVKIFQKELKLDRIPQKVTSLAELFQLSDELEGLSICQGNNKKEYLELFKHIQSKKAYLCNQSGTIRSNACSLIDKENQCVECKLYGETLRKCLKRKKDSKMSTKDEQKQLSGVILRTRLLKKAKVVRLWKEKCARMQIRLKKHLNKNQITITETDSAHMKHILSTEIQNLDKNSFLYLFLTEQLKVANSRNPHGVRWHPLVLKWCNYIYNKSPATYNALRGSKFCALPSTSTIYRHMDFSHSTGISDDAIEKLLEVCKEKGLETEHQKYISIVHDEMCIREDLVYEKNSGNLVGFVNLNSVGNELQKLEKQISGGKNDGDCGTELATHMLVLQARGITSRLKHSFASFAVNNVTSEKLHFILWEAIEKLESSGLKVLAVISDGAGTNRKFYRMNAHPHLEFPYKTTNVYAVDEDRDVYFISDPPHLLKTLRNSLSNSNFHQKSRRLWKNGKEILWTHFLQLYEMELNRQPKLAHKLTYEHVHLTSFAKMRVRLAAEILSGTVAKAMKHLLGSETSETVNFVEKANKFFDLMNVRSVKEGIFKRNEDLLPFRDPNDPRLTWLSDELLGYFRQWKKEIDERQGFSSAEKKRMFISEETYEGIGITVNSVIEIVKFMLKKDAKFILTSHLNQDTLEMEFALQRGAGGSRENPSVKEFLQNARKIKELQRHIVPNKQGNVTQVEVP